MAAASCFGPSRARSCLPARRSPSQAGSATRWTARGPRTSRSETRRQRRSRCQGRPGWRSGPSSTPPGWSWSSRSEPTSSLASGVRARRYGAWPTPSRCRPSRSEGSTAPSSRPSPAWSSGATGPLARFPSWSPCTPCPTCSWLTSAASPTPSPGTWRSPSAPCARSSQCWSSRWLLPATLGACGGRSSLINGTGSTRRGGEYG
mmetsp:Transcript_29475/g.93006  ORF Transcript_29475/g.93006 Transcript_29475/m.93006 type:complete len:204 (-) Transcript_29475:1094-1705(-)